MKKFKNFMHILHDLSCQQMEEFSVKEKLSFFTCSCSSSGSVLNGNKVHINTMLRIGLDLKRQNCAPMSAERS